MNDGIDAIFALQRRRTRWLALCGALAVVALVAMTLTSDGVRDWIYRVLVVALSANVIISTIRSFGADSQLQRVGGVVTLIGCTPLLIGAFIDLPGLLVVGSLCTAAVIVVIVAHIDLRHAEADLPPENT